MPEKTVLWLCFVTLVLGSCFRFFSRANPFCRAGVCKSWYCSCWCLTCVSYLTPRELRGSRGETLLIMQDSQVASFFKSCVLSQLQQTFGPIPKGLMICAAFGKIVGALCQSYPRGTCGFHEGLLACFITGPSCWDGAAETSTSRSPDMSKAGHKLCRPYLLRLGVSFVVSFG
ncbi:unnamed protein product [Ectocarpus sp. 4 AP-2014]